MEKEKIKAAVAEAVGKELARRIDEETENDDKADENETLTSDIAENAADAQSDGDNRQNTVAGKFRNPEELARAYGELEKEFTRKSQRLSELERELGKKEEPSAPDEIGWREAVDKFFKETPAAKPFAKDIARELMANPGLKDDPNCLSNALTRVLVNKFRTPEQLLSDGQFLKDYVLTSDAVRGAVIAAYLKELREGKPPAVLADGGQPAIAPRSKPRSLEEAGQLFLKNNK